MNKMIWKIKIEAVFHLVFVYKKSKVEMMIKFYLFVIIAVLVIRTISTFDEND
jgi:hypothetical protein